MGRYFGICALIALLGGCGGGGGGSPALPPAVPKPVSDGHSVTVELTFTVPAPKSSLRRPSTVAAATMSVSVGVNALAAQTFNASLGAPGCSTSGPITCTEPITAPTGSDTFKVTAFSAIGGGGVALDKGTVVQTINADGAQTVPVTLMPVVSVTSGGVAVPGSLAYAIANANSGDTITFTATSPTTYAIPAGIPILASTPNLTIDGANNAILDGTGITGGAMFNMTGGTVTLKNTTIQNCHQTGSSSGAIFLNGGALTLSNVLFSSDTVPAAYVGGAIQALGGTLSVIGGTTFTADSAGMGGAVYLSGSVTSTFSAATFNNNTALNGASGSGGAIYAGSSGTTTISGNSAFNGNLASASGGAIVIPAGATAPTISTDTFTGNKAGDTVSNNGTGGAIAIATGITQSISASIFTANQALSCNSCAFYGEGGAVYAAGTAALTLATDNFGTSGVPASGNSGIGQYGGYGGAVYANGMLTVSGGNFYYNSVSSSTTGSTSYGGAIWVNGTLGDSGGTIFDHNSAGSSLPVNSGGAGGAINANAGVISGATFTNNSAIGSGSGAGNGGAICSGASLQIGDSVIGSGGNGNIASTAGAGYYGMGSASDQIYRTSIDSNTITGASPTSGAGVYIASGTTLSLSQDTISNNQLIGSASATGGGLMNNGSTSVQNTTFFGNASSNLGGNIYNNGTLGIILSTVVRGTAGSNSGNVYNVTSTGTIMTNGTIYAYGNGSTSTSGVNNNFVISSNDYNDILGSITGSFTPNTHDQTFDPNLSPTLALNGSSYGPFTDAPGAPLVLDIIPYGAGCTGSSGVTTDERGMFRAIGTSHPTVCTIGAYADP